MLLLVILGGPRLKRKVRTNSNSFKLLHRFVSVVCFKVLQKCLETKTKYNYKEKGKKILRGSPRSSGEIFNC